MDLIKTEFRKAQKALSYIEVKKEIIYFEQDETADTQNSESEKVQPITNPKNGNELDDTFSYTLQFQGSDTRWTEGLGVNFYGGDGNILYIESLIKEVKLELFENLRSHVNIKDKVVYLKEVIDFFSSIEVSILEDDQGNLKADIISFKEFSVNELSEREDQMLKHFIMSLKSTLRKSLLELHSIFDKLNPKNITDKKVGKQSKTLKSFTIVEKDMLHRDEFKAFYNELSHDYIRCEDIRNFRKVFSGQSIDEKVIWKGDKGALKYFIRKLLNKGVIESPSYAFYKIVAHCFKYETEEINNVQLSHEHEPSDQKVINDLDEILDNLIELKASYQK